MNKNNFFPLDREKKFHLRGFTLIEFVVVIAIISILAVLVIPLIGTQTKQAKIKATKSEMLDLKEALLSYYEDVYNQEVGPINRRGHIFPRATGNAEIDLSALEYKTSVYPNNTNIRNRWKGPYIESKAGRYGYARDAWDTPYQYNYTMGDEECYLRSAGPDKIFGTSDDIPKPTESPFTISGKIVLKEKIDKVKAELAVIEKAAQQYYEDNGSYPSSIGDLIPGYIQEAYRQDEWDNDYIKWPPGQSKFISKGPDGRRNTQDDIDITK
jgi:prepilin-type N-terminal cleavage/methylation domain-containing protein